MCLFLFDVLKHDKICLVCGDCLFWRGCSFHLRSNHDFCSSVLQAMWMQLHVCDCIQPSSESCSFRGFGAAVCFLDSEQFIWKSPMLVS